MYSDKYTQKRKSLLKLISLFFLAAALGLGGLLCYLLQDAFFVEPASPVQAPAADQPVLIHHASKEKPLFLTDLIAKIKPAVYTIYTSDSEQGSGFLIDANGHMATNAHVVSGHLLVTVKSADGIQYKGTVIGYSSQTDVALIEVPALTGHAALLLETEQPAQTGEKVIAFGSPFDKENTATFGYITKLNQSFVIEPYVYDNLYETSASIAPGSSGGPLVSQETGRVLAINSAFSNEHSAIGYSIPCKDVAGMLNGWSQKPMELRQVARLYEIEENPVLEEEAVLEKLPSFILEDINQDGKRTIQDLTEDINKDGIINELDLEELLVQYP